MISCYFSAIFLIIFKDNNFLVVSYHEKSLLSLGLSQVKKGVLLFYYLIRSDEESGGGVVYKMVTFGEVSLWSLITGAMLYDC
jgi:hypothetical protein